MRRNGGRGQRLWLAHVLAMEEADGEAQEKPHGAAMMANGSCTCLTWGRGGGASGAMQSGGRFDCHGPKLRGISLQGNERELVPAKVTPHTHYIRASGI